MSSSPSSKLVSALLSKKNKPDKDNDQDDAEALLLKDEEAGMAKLDESIDNPCHGVFLSSARGARNIVRMSSDQQQQQPQPTSAVSLIITAARSLCPKQPSEEEKSLTLDVHSETTTEEDCDAFFERILPGLTVESPSVKRIYIALDDNATQNIKPVILPFAKFLKKYLSVDRSGGGGGVLVHCVLGKSRSVALVAGYLMFASCTTNVMMLADAMDIIRKARPVADVNPCFGAQLFALWRREVFARKDNGNEEGEKVS